jgi:hypothetical protein
VAGAQSRLGERDTIGKYSRFSSKPMEKKELNPIWRGIGCILIVVVPLLSYGLMLLSVPAIIATGKVPPQLMGQVNFPDWAYRTLVISGFTIFIHSLHNLWLNLIVFFVMALILTAIASLLYSMLYSLIGPARYTEVDAPPSKYKARKYTR